MAELNEKLSKVLKDCGLGKDAVWKHQQSGKWIVYHWACEVAAASKGIKFAPPFVVSADPANKLAVICVTGKLGEQEEWSFGEAAPYNTQQNYPFAMAEKRAKDRVILKLIGLHGLVYSEEEADDFKTGAPQNRGQQFHGPLKITELKEKMRQFAADLGAVTDEGELAGLLNSYQDALDQCMRDLPNWWFGVDGSDVKGIRERIEEVRQSLKQAETIYA